MALKDGLPDIIAELEPAVRAALIRGAQEVTEAAKNRVPVETGRLQRAIHWEITDEGVEVIAGDHDAFYGHIVEHGSAAYGTPPHPFLVPALEERRGDVVDGIRAAIRKVTG